MRYSTQASRTRAPAGPTLPLTKQALTIGVCLEPVQDKLESTGRCLDIAGKRILNFFDAEEETDKDCRQRCYHQHVRPEVLHPKEVAEAYEYWRPTYQDYPQNWRYRNPAGHTERSSVRSR